MYATVYTAEKLFAFQQAQLVREIEQRRQIGSRALPRFRWVHRLLGSGGSGAGRVPRFSAMRPRPA